MFNEFTLRLRPTACQHMWLARLACIVVLAVTFSGCNRTSAAKSSAFSAGPCVIALAAHQGEQKLNAEIRRLQQQIKESPANTHPQVEQLGGEFAEKARRIGVEHAMRRTVCSRVIGLKKNIRQTKLKFLLTA